MFHPAIAPSDKNTLASHQPKKRRLDDNQSIDDHLVTFDALSTDELARIFEYLLPEKIVLARLNKKMRDAATKTVLPISNTIRFGNTVHVVSVRRYHALATMATALPNLQQIVIGTRYSTYHPTTFKYNDGEDPDAQIAAFTANRTTHDIGILSNFTRLRELEICRAPLNGRYPMLFNFPLLQKLDINTMPNLKWDLEMLVGLPSLKELRCQSGIVTGSMRSLRVLKGTLSKIYIERCRWIWGNIICLAEFPKLKYLCLSDCGLTADFEEMSEDAFPALETLQINHCRNVRGNIVNLSVLPHLKFLDLWGTNVTGDIRDIGSGDFPSLGSLYLPPDVYGGSGFQLQRISDAPVLAAAVSTLLKQRPDLELRYWYAALSNESPDWYEGLEDDEWESLPFPPLSIKFVKAGSRLGWRWIGLTEFYDHPCEINWVDPEPSAESDDYKTYIRELAKLEKKVTYKGFHQPPTEEEYRRIYSGYL